jgi:hypothetical protein
MDAPVDLSMGVWHVTESMAYAELAALLSLYANWSLALPLPPVPLDPERDSPRFRELEISVLDVVVM